MRRALSGAKRIYLLDNTMSRSDNPDTIAMENDTEWQPTMAEDVFKAEVRVAVTWKDIEAAVVKGAVVPAEAYALWAEWAAPGSPMVIGSTEAAHAPEGYMEAPPPVSSGRTPMPPIRRVHGELPDVDWTRGARGDDDEPAGAGSLLTLVLGAILLVGALGLFLMAGWEGFGHIGLGGLAAAYAVGAVLLAVSLLKRGFRATGGFVAALVLLLVPVSVWALRSGILGQS